MIVVLYPFVDEDADAIAKYVRSLGGFMSMPGVPVKTLPQRRRLLGRRVLSGRVRRFETLLLEWVYLLRAEILLLRNWRKVSTVIILDYPPQLRHVGRLARVVNPKIRKVAWVLDLFWLASDPSTWDAHRSAANCKAGERYFRALAKCDEVVVIGECMRERIFSAARVSSTLIPLWSLSGVPAGKRIAQRGHGAGNFSSSTSRAQAPIRLLYSGSIRDLHPLEALVTAVESLGSDLVQLTICSRDVESVPFAHSRRTVSLLPRVSEEELDRLYASADLHLVVLAEWATGTCVPSKAYAAMSAGRGVLLLGSEDGQVARDLMLGQAGIVVRTYDVEGIRRSLLKIADGSVDAVSLGLNAAEFMRAYRSIEAAADAWSTVLDRSRTS
jgi:glycosyltransferase involved in cell wall biosynthesis